MKRTIYFLVCFLAMNGLVSCSFPAQPGHDSSQEEIVHQYQEVSAFLTQTAQARSVSMPSPATVSTLAQPLPVSSPKVLSTTTMASAEATVPVVYEKPAKTLAVAELPYTSKIPGPTQIFPQSNGEAPAAPCNRAQLGTPFDINVPDGTVFQPEETFSKTWRLVNTGSCRWTADYAVVWFSGNGMGVNHAQPLNIEVLPGGSVDITVDMVAPMIPGTYQSNWKLRGSDGKWFGIGPNGDSPFWARIVVTPVETETPTATLPAPEAARTPTVYASGSTTLWLGEGIDLDSARINQAENDDLGFQSGNANAVQLEPLADAHLSAYGISAPQIYDCQEAGYSNHPVILQAEQVGVYYCYRTNKGLPGWVLIKSLDLEVGQVGLEFVTWVVP